jgi:hypothetical protein
MRKILILMRPLKSVEKAVQALAATNGRGQARQRATV